MLGVNVKSTYLLQSCCSGLNKYKDLSFIAFFSNKEPIAMDRTTVTCPMIDVIHKDTFGYETQAGDAMRGAFDWELYYKRIPIPPEKQLDDPSSPFE